MASETESGSEQSVTLTQLRKNVYQLVDKVIATGKPLSITRGGCWLRLGVVSQKKKKLANLKRRDTIIGSDSDVESEQTHEWSPDNGFD